MAWGSEIQLPRVESAGWDNPSRITSIDRPPYQQDAACRTAEDPSVFFPSPGDTEALKAAKAMCATCPGVDDCLKYALENNERYGIWGGKSTRERLLILRAKRLLEAGEA